MKNLKVFVISILATSLLFACSKDQTEESVFAKVNVHLDGFNVSQEDFPGSKDASSVANYDGINAVTLAFYTSDGTEVYKHEQLKSDNTTFTTFGEFSLSLSMGSYTMVAVAYHTSDGNPLVLTSPTVAEFTGRSYETFAVTQAVTISNTSAVDISATLNRIIAKLLVNSTDGKTADVSNVRMTFFAGGKAFNPTTGLAIVNTGFANTVGNSAAVGSTSTSMSFLFLATDEQTMDVTIETLDADGNTLFSKTVSNVPFKRNRVTKLIGAMYTNTGIAGSFQVNTEWLDDEEVSF